MDVRFAAVARAHDGLVSRATLIAAGLTSKEAERGVAGLRPLHDGVWLTGHGRLTDHQRRLAAVLTAPGTVLSHASAAALHGFRPHNGAFEIVTRPGSGGHRRIGSLLVCRSISLAGEVVIREGIPVTSAARTIVDLCAHLDERRRAKAVREAIRQGTATALELRLAAARHRGRRGTRGLADLAARLEHLPLGRARSDAEARALEVIDAAGLPAPGLNVRLGGEEADLSWPDGRLIIEIDGPQYHQDRDEDARKDRAWRAAGWSVERIASDVVFDDPEAFLALVSPTPRRGASAPPRGTAAS